MPSLPDMGTPDVMALARAAADISSRLGFNNKDRNAPWSASISSAA